VVARSGRGLVKAVFHHLPSAPEENNWHFRWVWSVSGTRFGVHIRYKAERYSVDREVWSVPTV